VLRRAAFVAVALLATGCGSAEKAGEPPSVTRHIVYDHVIGQERIWIADVDGRNPRRLSASGLMPEISPDGKWVVYVDKPVGDLRLVATDGGESQVLAKGLYTVPSWSPTSDRIAARVVVEEGMNEALASIDVETGDTVQLGDGLRMGWSFSPDGKKIVFDRAHGAGPDKFGAEQIDLFVSDVDGGEAKQITDTGDAGYPAWGPKAIAFSKLIPYNGWGRHEIAVVQPDGSGRKDVTGPLTKRFLMQGCEGLLPLDWSDNGSALLAGWSCEFSFEPIAIDPLTGAVRPIKHGSGAVALSADGQYALVQASLAAETPPEELKVLVVPFEGGEPTVVVKGATSPSWNR
jgi:WD40-like Beta Propeller Repeat